MTSSPATSWWMRPGSPKFWTSESPALTAADLHTVTGHAEIGQLIGTLQLHESGANCRRPRAHRPRSGRLFSGRAPLRVAHGPAAVTISRRYRYLRWPGSSATRTPPPSARSTRTSHAATSRRSWPSALEKEQGRRTTQQGSWVPDVRRYLSHEPIRASATIGGVPAEEVRPSAEGPGRRRGRNHGGTGFGPDRDRHLRRTGGRPEEPRPNNSSRWRPTRSTRPSSRPTARVSAATAALENHDIADACAPSRRRAERGCETGSGTTSTAGSTTAPAESRPRLRRHSFSSPPRKAQNRPDHSGLLLCN